MVVNIRVRGWVDGQVGPVQHAYLYSPNCTLSQLKDHLDMFYQRGIEQVDVNILVEKRDESSTDCEG